MNGHSCQKTASTIRLHYTPHCLLLRSIAYIHVLCAPPSAGAHKQTGPIISTPYSTRLLLLFQCKPPPHAHTTCANRSAVVVGHNACCSCRRSPTNCISTYGTRTRSSRREKRTPKRIQHTKQHNRTLASTKNVIPITLCYAALRVPRTDVRDDDDDDGRMN